MKIFTGLILIFLIVSVLTATLLPDTSFSQVIVPLVMLVAMPLMTYFSAKRNFSTNQRISETIEYNFNTDYLSIKGESFASQLTWDKIYKVTQTKNWLLIWQNAQIATPIPKRDIFEGRIKDLKQILNNHKVNNNL